MVEVLMDAKIDDTSNAVSNHAKEGIEECCSACDNIGTARVLISPPEHDATSGGVARRHHRFVVPVIITEFMVQNHAKRQIRAVGNTPVTRPPSIGVVLRT